MGLQEGLILLGAVVFVLVLLDAMRRKRAAARRKNDDYEDPEEEERRAQLARELPSLALDGKKPSSQQGLDPLFDDIEIFDDDPIPVLRNKQQPATSSPKPVADNEFKAPNQPTPSRQTVRATAKTPAENKDKDVGVDEKANESISVETQQTEEEQAWDKMRRKFSVDPSFATASRTSMEVQKKELLELQEVEGDLENTVDFSVDDLVELEHPKTPRPAKAEKKPPLQQAKAEKTVQVNAAAREKDLRTALLTSLEKSAWGSSDVFLTINVNAPSERPFIGSHLRQFMEIIGMKLSESGFYHYVEEKDNQSYLGYSLVNMFSPGSFDSNLENEFETSGVVLVMPLPNTRLPMAIFERMLATARVMEKNWGAELKDEQRSNLTQQTVEHYRQTIKDFEYQTRVNAKKAGRT